MKTTIEKARTFDRSDGEDHSKDYNLAASRYKPHVAEEVPDEDPAELIREVLAIERKMTAGLEKLLEEVKR